MDIKKLDRTALKSYFVKNAVPTESNFADLIDGTINQKEDGIAKLAGEPLSIQADGNDTSQKKAINFYKNFADPKPAWTLSLNPRLDPNNPATAKPGWSIGDADGNSKLYIDQTNGNLGIGTVTPGVKLDVNGALNVNGAANVNGALKVVFTANSTRDPDSKLSSGGSLVLKGNAPQIDFLDTDHNEWAIHVNSNKMYFIREPWNYFDLVLDGAGNVGMGTDGPRAKLEVRGGAIMPSSGNVATAGILFPPDPGGGGADSAWIRYYPRLGEACTLELGVSNDADDHIALMPSGGVGIGTSEPQGKLHVQTGGVGTWDRFVVKSTNLWGDGNTQYVTIGEGGAAGIMFYNPHVVWYAQEARASIRMGRSGGIPGGHWWDIGVRAGNMFSILDGGNGAFGLSISENGTVKVNVLQLGDKWRLSGVGDHEANDKWLRLKNAANSAYFGGFAAAELWTAGGVVQGSDRRLKKDLSPLRQTPEDILKLRAVRFKWQDAPEQDGYAMGLIAQEVEEIFPEVVSIGPDGMKGINYSVLVAPLIEAMKHQQAQIGELRAQIDALRTR